MDFAGLLHILLQPFRTDIAVDGDGDVRPDLPTLDQPVLEPRKTCLKVVDDLPHRGSRHYNLVRTVGEALQ